MKQCPFFLPGLPTTSTLRLPFPLVLHTLRLHQVQYPLLKDTKYQSHSEFSCTLHSVQRQLSAAAPTQRLFLTPLDHRATILPGFHATIQTPPIIGTQWLLKTPGQEAGPWCNSPEDSRELRVCQGRQNDMLSGLDSARKESKEIEADTRGVGIG